MKALIISDARGRILFGGASCPGSTADITQARQAGVVDWLDHTGGVEILTDAGYQGLGHRIFGQVIAPAPKHHKKRLENMPGITELRDAQRKAHAHRRVRVEHTIAHLKNWRSLTRHHGRHPVLDDTIRAIAGLLSNHQHAQPRRQPIAVLMPTA